MKKPKSTTELVKEFVNECCNINDPLMIVPKQVLFNAWETWSAGSNHIIGDSWFARNLLHVYPQIKTKRTTIKSKRCYVYIGIGLVNADITYNQKLLQAKIDTLYNVLHELNLFPDRFKQAKKDVQIELDELEDNLEFEQDYYLRNHYNEQ